MAKSRSSVVLPLQAALTVVEDLERLALGKPVALHQHLDALGVGLHLDGRLEPSRGGLVVVEQEARVLVQCSLWVRT